MNRVIKELVVISGKGGTGKTSIVASLAALAGGRAVCCDCDVDAADLHLLLAPHNHEIREFVGGELASIDPECCSGCGLCAEHCRFEAIAASDNIFTVDSIACEGCGVCEHFCPEGAIEMARSVDGYWFVADSRFGPMVHARLEPGGENSGKLVTAVRKTAKELAQQKGCDLIITDASPGVGCPVIASITGADMALIVTEPTLSGKHDLERVAGLAAQFGTATAICINKRDINLEIAESIGRRSSVLKAEVLAEIDYDPAFTAAQIEGISLVEMGRGATREKIELLWGRIADRLNIDDNRAGAQQPAATED